MPPGSTHPTAATRNRPSSELATDCQPTLGTELLIQVPHGAKGGKEGGEEGGEEGGGAEEEEEEQEEAWPTRSEVRAMSPLSKAAHAKRKEAAKKKRQRGNASEAAKKKETAKQAASQT